MRAKKKHEGIDIHIRLPADLSEAIKAEAEINERSIQSEILYRLKRSPIPEKTTR